MVIARKRVTFCGNRTRLMGCFGQLFFTGRTRVFCEKGKLGSAPNILEMKKEGKRRMTSGINDLVLVHIDRKPAFYARIEEISPDVKPGWWQVKLLVLTLPLQVYTWILEESQINGAPFTMGGTPVAIEKVVSPVETPVRPSAHPPREKVAGDGKEGKVVSLFDRKKDG